MSGVLRQTEVQHNASDIHRVSDVNPYIAKLFDLLVQINIYTTGNQNTTTEIRNDARKIEDYESWVTIVAVLIYPTSRECEIQRRTNRTLSLGA